MKVPSIVLAVALFIAASAATSSAQWLTSDKADYAPGETATLTGTDFAPSEAVVLQVHHTGATPDTGADHQPWTVAADANGGFVTTWHVCEDDCLGQLLLATADGQSSGLHAEAGFTDAGPFSNTPRPELPVSDNSVYATVVSGNTIYVGGDFTMIGEYTGSAVPLHPSTGLPVPGFPKVNGGVLAIVPDGSGGWYIAGNFTSVGGVPRNRVARIDASNNVTAWNPNCNGNVVALVLSGSTVYACGIFSSIGGAPRSFIAALDATTGLATAWNPAANGFVNTLAVSGGVVYAGGSFTNIGGQARSRIAALSAATGAATSWNPNATGGFFPNVGTIAVGGSVVYAAGSFSTIGGAPRSGLAALDASTGLATAWNPNPNSGVITLAVGGTAIYAGGFFTTIGGQARNRIAALDAATGSATGWNPNANGGTHALLVSGSTVYAAGDFSSIGGQTRNRIAALDAATGAATAWNPSGPETGVRSLATNGSVVYMGGVFGSAAAQPRGRIASFDATTGAVHPWNPNANGPVFSLAASGTILYAGGAFTGIGGQLRDRIAALDAGTGLATPWNPGANSSVTSLVVSGSVVYAGGGFTIIGGQARNRIAALSIATGLATSWNPNADGAIQRLVPSGTHILAGGSFTTIGGQSRNRLAAIDAATGSPTAWNPNADNTVMAILVDGMTVYVGGTFSTIGGQVRNRIAAVDASSGLPTAWNPNAQNRVSALAGGGGTIYAGGDFSTIGGASRVALAELDASTGLATAWNPGTNIGVSSIEVSGSTIHVGGSFGSIGGDLRRSIAAFGPACTPPVVTFCPPAVTVECGGSTSPSDLGTAIATGTGVTVSSSDVFAASGCVGGTGVITRTWTATGTCGTASCVQTITIVDTAAPLLTANPSYLPIQCPASPVFTAPTFADICDPAPQVIEVSDVTTPGPCAGAYARTRTWKARDCAGNESGLVSQTIQVQDLTAPVIAPLPAPSTIDCPAAPVFATPVVNDSCGSAVTLTSSDATTPGCGGAYSVTRTWIATDGCSNASTASQTIHVVDLEAPVVTITAPPSGAVFAVGTAVNFSATFTDDCGSPHTATWTFDAGTQPGIVTEGAPGTVTASHTFAAAGVYLVQLAVKDACDNADTTSQVGGVDAMVVIYDPSAGFVTGGGWIDSPAGAYTANPLLEGRANFGFVSKYKKGASVPTGETEFQYKVGNLNFHSTSYQWLVVAGSKAQFKGSGTINGAGSYDFILTAIDGDGSGDPDRFRMRITGSGGGLVYDNQLDAPDDDDPTTVLGGGSIVIHKGGNTASADAGAARDEAGGEVSLAALPAEFALSQNHPNPFDRSTLVAFSLPERSRISLVLYDLTGREVRTLADGEWEPGRHSATLSRTGGNGSTLGAGVYFLRMSARSLESGRTFSSIRKLAVVR